MPEKLRVAVYTRVSTDKEEQESSFKNQRSFFENEISKDDNCMLYDIYADKGLSGTNLKKRPEFNRMLYDAGIDMVTTTYKGKAYRDFRLGNRPAGFDEIWMKNTSRFARNIASYEIISMLRQKGVHIRFVEQNINTKDLGSELMLNLFQVFDAQDSRDKSVKVRTGHQEGARKGHMHVNGRIYGYSYDSATKELTIIPEEAEVIKKIFQWYADGEGMRRIREKLKAEGIYTRQGKDFTKSTLAKILSNEKYCGILVRNKYATGTVLVDKHSPTLKDKDEWYIHRGKVPAIIDEELFTKCQEIRESKVNVVNQKGIYKARSEYAGLIICGKCGSTYTRNIDKGRVFYNCGKKKREGVTACNNRNVTPQDIEGVLSAVDHGVFGSSITRDRNEAIERLKATRTALLAKIDRDSSIEIEFKQSEINKLKDRKVQLLMMLADPAFTMSLAEIKETILHIDNQIKGIENVIAELSKDNNAIHAEVNKVDQRIHQLMQIDPEDFDWRDELLHLIVYPAESGWEVKFKTEELIETLTRLV